LSVTVPEAFLAMMQSLLNAEEFLAFTKTYDQERSHGLRIHTRKLKGNPMEVLPFDLTPIPWCDTGYYTAPQDTPGRHPYHAAGLYYLQEPSAMAVAECLDVDASSIVLDLCAAPGGKSTQIANKLGKQGLLIANEIHPARAKILAENLERWGTVQTIVLNESPQTLKKRFPNTFTHILVDAPCSGEGMFRKDPEACGHWSTAAISHCVDRQKEILECAIPMLQPGGVLVYSTCTFNPYENEQVIEWLLQTYPECTLEPLPISAWVEPGRSDWTKHDWNVDKTGRLWPHRLKGEGHFVARVRKQGDTSGTAKTRSKNAKPTPIPHPVRKIWESFAQDSFLLESGEERTLDWIQAEQIPGEAGLVLFGNHLYLSPRMNLDFTGLRVVRPGVYLGEIRSNRLDPGHGLALAVDPQKAKRIVDLDAKSREVLAYLRGESLPIACERGWTLVTVDGHALGFAKSDGRMLKNHYPKGLRWNI
jgi:NOL1/NOP2/sun family putative RNA methylase